MIGVCSETGREVIFRAPADDYRTDARWRYADDGVCPHRIERVIVIPETERPQ